MKTSTDFIIARYTSTRAIPSWDKDAIITVDAKAYTLGENLHPYFSITANIVTPASKRRRDIDAGGCLHDEILRLWPQLAPIVALHLSDANTGEPMHAESNAVYWAGGVVNLGAEYHGGTGSSAKNSDECLRILAEHLRISQESARALCVELAQAFTKGAQTVAPTDAGPIAQKHRAKAGRAAMQAEMTRQADGMRPRWQAEAQAGIALLHELTARQAAKRGEREARQTVAA